MVAKPLISSRFAPKLARLDRGPTENRYCLTWYLVAGMDADTISSHFHSMIQAISFRDPQLSHNFAITG